MRFFSITKSYLTSSLHAVDLDRWVFNQIGTLLRNGTNRPCSQCETLVWQSRVLPASSRLGYGQPSCRPHSPEYMRNIRVIDENVKRTEELVREFYKDDEQVTYSLLVMACQSLGTAGMDVSASIYLSQPHLTAFPNRIRLHVHASR